jgi:hypothetical protein
MVPGIGSLRKVATLDLMFNIGLEDTGFYRSFPNNRE